MEVWLTLKGERLRLPVTPFYRVPFSNNNSNENLNEVGTINLAGKPGLRTCSLVSFFPGQNYEFLENTDSNNNPFFYDRKIREWARLGEPLRLIITETPHNFEVLIDSYDSGEDDGTGDVYYTLELSEYVRIETTEVDTTNGEIKKESIERFDSQSEEVSKQLTTATEHDTPLTMALKLTGNEKNVTQLLNQNDISITDNITGKEFKV